MKNIIDSHQVSPPKTYKISLSLIKINFPKEITSQGMTTFLTIVFGVPLSLLFWIYSFNNLMSLSSQPILSPPPATNTVIETNP
ncbi:hypothetical protein VB715_16325 [Crocosphaera sp. UHCC 0190]|uniref:hypothetical protein n=1 Tax=Crocosphaera sp. UHCC 0190 TaxID=3110246 RepID=UPI002B1FB86D|nr:hypothetical protein [Crocosphaera sp. UHCC 0190]MEA5511341.1 hypothetical protein [Crocosphaera sp. UHCC 0190]